MGTVFFWEGGFGALAGEAFLLGEVFFVLEAGTDGGANEVCKAEAGRARAATGSMRRTARWKWARA